ncbi:uncharacterized protein LOC144434574 [Glandiceps talaboti]
MEHYEKGKTVELPTFELPPHMEKEESSEVIQMRVLHGSKIWNLMGFALKKIKEEQVRKVVWNGSGHAVTKAVTCAEIMKRKVKNLHQNTQIFYKRIEEVWEPKEEGLDSLKVNRDIPAISITLSKDVLDTKIPGYQAPNSVDALWSVESHDKDTPIRTKRKQSAQKGRGPEKRQQHKQQSKKVQQFQQAGCHGDGSHDNRNKQHKGRSSGGDTSDVDMRTHEGPRTEKESSERDSDYNKKQKAKHHRPSSQIGRGSYRGGKWDHQETRGAGRGRGNIKEYKSTDTKQDVKRETEESKDS